MAFTFQVPRRRPAQDEVAANSDLICTYMNRDHATAIRAITAHSLDLDAPTPSSIIARLLRVDSESITVSYQLRKPASEGDSDSQGTQEDEGQLEEGEIMIRPPIEGVNQAAGRLLALAKEATQSLKWPSLPSAESSSKNAGASSATKDPRVIGPHPLLAGAIIFGMFLTTFLAVVPNAFTPLALQWLRRSVGGFLVVRVIAILAWLAHAGEAFVAYRIATGRGYSAACVRSWTFSTFCFGFGTLGNLLAIGKAQRRAQ